MSNAGIGYDTEFRIKATSAAVDFTPLAEVYNVTPPESSIDQIEVTHFKSPGRKREFIPALSDNGTASCEMNFVPGSATDLLIEALIASGDVVAAEVEYPNGTVVAFNCSVSGYSKGIPVDDRMTATAEFQVTGDVTITAGAGVLIMANGFKGEIGLVYDGQSYTMVLDFNALCDFEGETGKNALISLEGMEQGDMSASDTRALMWAGLRQRHPDMTLQLAGCILSENADAIQRATEAIALEADSAEKKSGNRKRPSQPRA